MLPAHVVFIAVCLCSKINYQCMRIDHVARSCCIYCHFFMFEDKLPVHENWPCWRHSSFGAILKPIVCPLPPPPSPCPPLTQYPPPLLPGCCMPACLTWEPEKAQDSKLVRTTLSKEWVHHRQIHRIIEGGTNRKKLRDRNESPRHRK